MQDATRPPGAVRRPREGTSGWVIGHAAGAPIVLAPSWLVAAALLTLFFAPTVRRLAPVLGEAATYAVALIFVVLLFVSVFLHELAHGFAARAHGLRVHEFAITLWGGHTSFAGNGATPRASALIAVVGPLTNLLLAGLAWFAAQALPPGLVAAVLYAAAFANAFVGAFNLVPGLPLDGGRVLEAVVWRVTGDRHRATVVAGWAGRVVALAVVAWALVGPLLSGGRPSVFTVLWTVLVAGFLWKGATQAMTGASAQRAVEGLSAARLGRPAAVVPTSATLADAQGAAQAAGVGHVVVLAPDGRPVAYVDAAAAGAVPRPLYATTQVLAVAVPLPPGAVVDAGAQGADLAHEVNRVAPTSPVMALVDGAHVTGLLFTRDVVAALRSRTSTSTRT